MQAFYKGAVYGPPGSGKTYTTLLQATGLAERRVVSVSHTLIRNVAQISILRNLILMRSIQHHSLMFMRPFNRSIQKRMA